MSEPAFLQPQEAGNPLPIGEVGRPTGSGVGRTHGTVSTYQAGCRCVDCRAAKRLYARHDIHQKVSNRRRDLAVKYVRENLPHTWLRLRLQAEEELTGGAAE